MVIIPFQDYLEQLSSTLASMYKGKGEIACKVEAYNIEIDIDTAIPLGLIVNELVSNADKYAFPEDRNGKIVIALKRQDDKAYQLLVKDDGVGLPAGIDPEKSTSLGLRLVSILTRQLNGEITLKNENGTSIIITFTEAVV